MRKLIVIITALVVAGCADSKKIAAAPNPVAQITASRAALSWRFIGLEALKAKTNLVVFREAAGLPEYEGFRSNLTVRIAERFAKMATPQGSEPAELQKLLMPIAADLVQYPSLFEKEAGASNICSLAVQLPNERHEVWKKNWDGILKAGKIPGAKLSREGAWTLISNGSSKAILDRARSSGPEVLQIDGDGSFLGKFLPGLSPTRGNMRVTTQGNGLRSEGKLQLEKDVPFKLDAWKIPVNTIREPLIGFTAVQGVAERLGKLELFNGRKAPNQMFVWSADETPFSTYLAARVEDSTNFLRAVADFALKKGGLFGRLEMNTNRHRLALIGLPIAIPFLGVAPNDAGFVFGGAIPVENISSNPLPDDLAGQVRGRTNLVYYDWELTGPRSRQARAVWQVIAMATNKKLPTYEVPAHKWLLAADKKIGNTITEVALAGPREITFIRRSDLGLSSVELVALMEWITGPREGAPGGPPAVTPR